nr:DNA integrity scanning diadenylate cyclase DisA [Rothia sp. ZJ1223]
MLKTIARIAPGTELREGLERIMRGHTGALIVLGSDKTVNSISSGGFEINTAFTPTGLRELSKMDGAIICDKDARILLNAAVQLMPDPTLETNESGTRHRTAHRVAQQTGFPVIAVSASTQMISVYVDGQRYTVEDTQSLMSRANQAIQTLESYRNRLEQVLDNLSALEIEGSATVRDVVLAVQRMEMVRRISLEAGYYVLELGTHGRLVSLQLEELINHSLPDAKLILKDYSPIDTTREQITRSVEALVSLGDKDIVSIEAIAKACGFDSADLDALLAPHGYRLLSGIKNMPGAVAARLVNRFNGIPALMSASIDELRTVDGIGEQRARIIRESLSRMAETLLLEQFK